MNMQQARTIIDCTHALSPTIPSFDGDCCFSLSIGTDYADCTPPNIFRVQDIHAKAGAGTHIDAPAHCIPGGKTIDALALETLHAECVVIHAEKADEKYQVMPADIERFEKEHGKIPPNAFVIFHTGWDVHWNTPKKYRNDLHFPSVHETTATLLLERNVVGIGIDTLSSDSGGKDFPVHRILLGAGKYLVENVANAGKLPPTGAKITIAPIKIKDGTEAPVRLIAYLP